MRISVGSTEEMAHLSLVQNNNVGLSDLDLLCVITKDLPGVAPTRTCEFVIVHLNRDVFNVLDE